MEFDIKKERENCGFDPNDEKITLPVLASGGVIPGIYVDTDKQRYPNDDEAVVEVLFADGVSGGADYVNDMPRAISMVRLTKDGQKFTARYEQVTKK